jgi:hypothetical protein
VVRRPMPTEAALDLLESRISYHSNRSRFVTC